MIKSAYSTKQSAKEALIELNTSFGNIEPKMILFFVSSTLDYKNISQGIKESYPKASVFGCTTAGEISSGKILDHSLVAMAFDEQSIDQVKLEVVKNLTDKSELESAFQRFEDYFKIPMREMDYSKYIGIILIDGMSKAEEKVMDHIGSLSNIMFIGGSAGDDLKFKETFVFADGQTYANAAVIALLNPKVKFDFIKTQSFCETSTKLVATKVNEDNREVLEFNGKPAVNAYSEALGLNSGIDIASHFMDNPVGLMIQEEPFVRSPQQIQGSSVLFYCKIMEGMELSLLKSMDIVNDTKNAIKEKNAEFGHISGIINFNCILRTLELKSKNQTQEYGDIFANIPTVGFSTYGEQFIGHINQTATMLIFR
jgi:hypothetical protein